ncbi:hypothetical protein [Primorskyibacter sedentarius]|uniref:hypothetical protein n=1 Tax=Primorskyibacter sedentarius TaxID=745311 RepID=UPI003EBF6529
MAAIEFHVKPQGPVLEAYYLSEARVSLIMGPLGSGKTIMSCHKIMRHMRQQKPNASGVRKSRWYAIRNTYGDLLTTTIKDWLEIFGDLGRFKSGGREPPTHYLKFHLEDSTLVEAEVVFIALDREEHVKKLRGSQVTGFWLNEVKELEKAVVDMADLRHGRYPSPVDGGATWHGMIGDTNAPDEDHWYYKQAEEEKPDGWVFFKQPGGVYQRGVDERGRPRWAVNQNAENAINLPDGYYLRGMAGKSDDWIKVNLANEYGFVMDGKPVYPTYVDSLHCREFDVIPGLPIIRGWDYGLTPACMFAQLTPRGQLRFIDEMTATRSGIGTFTDEVLKHCAMKYPGFEFIDEGDPAGDAGKGLKDNDTRSCFEIQAAKGINVNPGPVSLELRLESVRYGLNTLVDGEPALVVHPCCKMFRKGFQGGYQFRRMQIRGEHYTDKPDKNHYSHPHDAGQYIASRVFADIIRDDEPTPDKLKRMQQTAIDMADPYDETAGGIVIPRLPRTAVDDFDVFGG